MISFLSWVVAVELLALAVLPMAVRLFRSLPDRGYVFAKPLGILVVVYVCWILGVIGALRFQPATIAVVLLLVGVGCWIAWGREARTLLVPVRRTVFLEEIFFLVALVLAAFVRAHNPEISGTEKPMDFAFLNALYRSDTFPPEDPWMSGNSISYYYFGYLLLAAVAKFSGVPAAVGYNLGVALVFALTVAGSFSLAFNLVSMLEPRWRLAWRVLGSALAPLMIGVMGNLEAGFELLAVRGVGDTAFWKQVGIKGLEAAQAQTDAWLPSAHWWWWRASRVIPTIQPDGISEFPYFSFLLGDLHPHYMALPWGILGLALALAVLMARASRKSELGESVLSILAAALSLGFLMVGNSWDFPTYSAIFWMAALLPLEASDWTKENIVRRVKVLALVSFVSVVLYAPFMVGFSSQTKGIGISADKTPLVSMLIIFGPFLFGLVCLLVWRGTITVRNRWQLLFLMVGAVLLMGSWFLGAVWMLLGVLSLVGAAACSLSGGEDGDSRVGSAAERFVLLLVGVGVLLVLTPEFVFLVDLFGTRMNTVFKFHYQAWLLLGLASAVSLVWMAGRMSPLLVRWCMLACSVSLVCVGLLYPLSATPAKTGELRSRATLDGAAFYQTSRPDDYGAIRWLSNAVSGRPVVLEATGGEYSEYGRVSTFSGLPSVLGWAGHEVQWRGRGEEPQRRAQDIEAIYRSADRTAIRGLLQKYGVEYVFVGSLERELFGPTVTSRFEGLLDPVHRQGGVTIYHVQSGAGA